MASVLTHALRKTVSVAASRTLDLKRTLASAAAAVAPTRYHDAVVQRQLLVNVLNANVTKRDAKQYIAKFKIVEAPPKKVARPATEAPSKERKDGNFHVHTSIKTTDVLPAPSQEADFEELHLALVCLKSPETIGSSIIESLATIVSQVVKLGMRTVFVLDHEQAPQLHDPTHIKALRQISLTQAERLCQAIERQCPEGAQFVPNALEYVGSDTHKEGSAGLSVPIPALLLEPLARGMVIVLPSSAYNETGQLVSMPSRAIMSCLTNEFLNMGSRVPESRRRLQVDRIVVVDPAGSIPTKDKSNASHVFINLEQQYEEIDQALSEANADQKVSSTNHRNSLDIVRECLSLLPASSSGLILSPAAAANLRSGKRLQHTSADRGVKHKCLLIHNLLTNRPIVSCSLPSARLPSLEASAYQETTATLIKRGMKLAIVPDMPWHVPLDGSSDTQLENDPKINFQRLVQLVNSSFGRTLDVSDYLVRTKNRIAGVIIAGDYEGGAIFTWEQPPNVQDPSRIVPYLDKFMVSPSSQGSSGVADILFQTMVACFPDGVCWRSRKTNPANKWYFERANGTWKIPDSQWTVFWTGDEAVTKDRWRDYVAVASSVRASWMDEKQSS